MTSTRKRAPAVTAPVAAVSGSCLSQRASCASTFSIPFTWTQTVNAGDAITFALYLNSRAFAVAGTAGLDISNTFKITGIALPTGYSYNSDAQGFLSEFALAPVPEPETYVLMLAGLGLLAAAIQQALDFTAQGGLLAFDDCGVVINHAIVEGQLHGAVVQGAGQVLGEHMIYDRESGQPLTASFMDYYRPRAWLLRGLRG